MYKSVLIHIQPVIIYGARGYAAPCKSEASRREPLQAELIVV